MDALADHLESADYDFVCLQEVWTESDQIKIKNRCKQNLPFSVTFFG
jgi:exonuclease III